MAILGLPNELIHSILECTEDRDLLFLCRTNQRMHTLCLHWIYRTINLDDPAQVANCCKSVILRPEIADAVRKLEFGLNSYPPGYDVREFDRTVKSAVHRMKNLHGLEVYSSTIFRLFSDSQFPNLSQCGIPYCAEVIPFLKRHPTIVGLRVFPWYEGDESEEEEEEEEEEDIHEQGVAFEFTSLIQPIHMPRLEQFTGPAVVASAVASGSPMCDITIEWRNHDITGMSFSDVLSALSRTNTVVRQLRNIVCGLDNRLVSAIVEYMPQITDLIFENVMEDVEDEEKERFLSSIADALLHLPVLLAFSIRLHASEVDMSLDAQFEALRKLGDYSSSLRVASFSRNMYWVGSSNVWVPYTLDSHTSEPIHNFTWFFIKVATTPALPPIYAAFAERLVGVDGMLAVKSAIEKTGVVPDLLLPF
ncbi:hypothetical protein DFH07DRAFT_807155 [Mycena maculata]|uniref:F-box domain-containing protein n=1 Tax=Mycena maculata TaxID=230809 RepID=A0AAD7JPF7_9AGAR|nr:hypothetical protein DFH07DRAFT_807155 [Mycena maculata]